MFPSFVSDGLLWVETERRCVKQAALLGNWGSWLAFAGQLMEVPEVVPARHGGGHPDALLEVAAYIPCVTPADQIAA